MDTRSGIEAGLVALSERVWRGPVLRGRVAGYAVLEGLLESGDAWYFERALRRPVGSAEALARALLVGLGSQDARGAGRWPPGPLLDLRLMVSELSAETGRQPALRLRSQPPRRTLPEVPGVDRLVDLAPWSPLPERRWVLAPSLAPLVAPLPVEVDTEWWMPEPVRRRYWRLALADGCLVTVYRDLLTGDWFWHRL